MGKWSLKIETNVSVFIEQVKLNLTECWLNSKHRNKQTTGLKFMYWSMGTKKIILNTLFIFCTLKFWEGNVETSESE